MAELQRLESAVNDPSAGGFVIRFPSGASKGVSWTTKAPIAPTFEAAKQFAAAVIEALSKEARFDDMERTNWPSCIAAIQRIIDDFNERLSAHLYATGPSAGLH